MKQKAFTLIELLVVVAIIGILAAVGVVAYNGYTGAAKVSATKANHKSIVKFMPSEIMKCSLGENTIFEGNLNCSESNNASKAGQAAVKVFQEKFTNAWQPNHVMKAYSSGIYWSNQSCANNNQNLGIICFYTDKFNNKVLNVEVCFKESCKDPKNILISKFTFD
jgi:prepilin-type N-terminal cleavage/methylation domain-containing protein